MDVMMKMTTEDARRLRAQFTKNLTLEQFVSLMKMNLRDRIANELDFTVSTIDLFHAIDVNGDKTVEWDEFAGYMLDAGQAKADFADARNDRDGKMFRPWDLAFRDAKTPMNRIRTYVQQLAYLSDLPAIAYFENGADVVSIYALHFDQNEAPRHVATIRLHTAFQEHVVLDMCYVPVKKWLTISSMRGPLAYLSVWQVPELSSQSRSPMMLRRIELGSPQEQLTWLPTLQLLATASAVFPSIASRASSSQKATKIHQLLLWDLGTLSTFTDFDHRDRIKGVTSMIEFTTPSNRVFLVVGREDGQITVVETENSQDVQTLDAHGHGVRVLAHSSECEVLASAGAHAYASDESTHYILIWRISFSGRLSVETTLRDHEAPLQLLQFVDSKRQLLSADIYGVFHVYSSAGWSPEHEKWQCLQVFEASYRVNKCLMVPESAHSDAVLITAGTHVAFFDLCVSREREEMIFAYYCRELNVVVGVTATTVFLWNADTGKLWKSFTYTSVLRSTPPTGYNDATHDDSAPSRVISAVCVDDRERKLLLGDDRGSVCVVNIVNGNVVKALDPHDSAVLWIAYVLRSKRVISVSLDAVLHVADENNPIGFYAPLGASKPQSVVLRSLRFLPDSPSATMTATYAPAPEPSPRPQAPAAKFEVTRAIGNQELDLLALLVTGSHHGESFIQLWNFDLSHAQGTCVAPLEDEITCLCFYGSSGDIVGGTARGSVYLWAGGTSYRCSHELTAEVETTGQENASKDAEKGEMPPSSPTISPANVQILHILSIATESSISKDESNPETSTFLTADGAPNFREALPTVINSELPSKPILSKRHTVRERLKCETEDGVYVIAGDENGVITTWFIVRALDTNRKQKPTSLAQHKQPTEKDHQNTALFQHEEMAMGYEAIAALHANAQKANRRQQHKIHVCKARSRWQAHCSSVASLQVSTGDPLVVLSTNASGKVKIWNVRGDLLGVLDHFATRRMPERRPWRFPVDMEERQKQKEAFASQFLDRGSSAVSKRPVTRMTILQERLSMTPQEMANERSSMCTPKSMRRRITTVVQAGDVERAIRHLALSQLRPLSTGGVSGPRSRARSIPAIPPEPSLHALLTEMRALQPPTTAPAADTTASRPAGVDRDNLTGGGGRRRYSMATIADLKHALRPRSRMSQQPKSRSRSSASVHCDLALSPPSAHATCEVIVTTAAAPDGRIELTDLQAGALDREPSNQETEKKAEKKRADGILNYHVKLAHSWNKYAP